MKTLDYVNIGLTGVSIASLAATVILNRKKNAKNDPGVDAYIQAFENRSTELLFEAYSEPLKNLIESNEEMKTTETTLFPELEKKGISFRNTKVLGGYKSPNGPGYWIVRSERFLNGKFIGEIVWMLLSNEAGKINMVIT